MALGSAWSPWDPKAMRRFASFGVVGDRFSEGLKSSQRWKHFHVKIFRCVPSSTPLGMRQCLMNLDLIHRFSEFSAQMSHTHTSRETPFVDVLARNIRICYRSRANKTSRLIFRLISSDIIYLQLI